MVLKKTILIYANCLNTKAGGDFSFAGNIARDLVKEIKQKRLNLKVVLTSTLDGIPRFEKLYGNAVDGKISIDGESIDLISLELFDAVENTVAAFIEANRCKYAPAEIIKRTISPESKFLFVGNANQIEIGSLFLKKAYFMMINESQPGLYDFFNTANFLIGSAGLGTNNARLGLPVVTKSEDLPPLNSEQNALLPKGDYGFMYVNAIGGPEAYKVIAQYIKLSGLDQYILVGNFENEKPNIKWSYEKDCTFVRPNQIFPQITYHQSLPNPVMRKMVANSNGPLTLSTGIFSTLEALQDGKLVYYQNLSMNTKFVATYLNAIQSIVSDDQSLVGCMPQMIIELSNLLFADKPLKNNEMERSHELLTISCVNSKLIEANQKVIEQANGKLAPKLLTFISEANQRNRHDQLDKVCASLRKPGEAKNPKRDQALRRAAAWGRLLELKVLIHSMSAKELDLQDETLQQRNALHWATEKKNFDCLRVLINAGASLDIKDKDGKTVLHKAIFNRDNQTIKLLIEAGASLDLADNQSKTPKDCADSKTLKFIESCHRPNPDIRKMRP